MPVQLDVVWSTCYSRCILFVSTALSCLDVLIKYYHLSLYPRLRVPVPPSCVHRDRCIVFDVIREFVFFFFYDCLLWIELWTQKD